MKIEKALAPFLVIFALITFVMGAGFPASVRAATAITDCAGLQAIGSDLAGDYILGNDIDCSGVPDWTPLGTFTGKLDGDGFAIQHITIVGYTNGNAFFGNLDGAKIYNLSFTDADIETNFVGGVLATTAANDTKIVNVHVQGSIDSGALLSLTGGLVGSLDHSQIYYSSTNMSVTGYEVIGGLVGVSTNESVISRSSSQGSVTSYDFSAEVTAGGLVGNNNNSSISNSYSLSALSINNTNDLAGGLVGINQGTGSILNSYSLGSINDGMTPLSKPSVGGLVGRQIDSASTENSYWDTTTSEQATSAAGTGKSDAEMRTLGTYTDWDFDEIWTLPMGNYPILLSYDDTPAVLTEISQVSDPVKRSDIAYVFNIDSVGPQEYIVTPCGGISAAQVGMNNDGDMEMHLAQAEIGETYACEVYVVNLTDLESNHLTIGPFKVVEAARTGSRTYPITPTVPSIALPQPLPLDLGQQPATPAMGGSFLLTRNLHFGMVGSDVKYLQQFLNSHGFVLASSGSGSPGQETELFGNLTRNAVIRFQKTKGILPSIGYVGPITRGFINN